MPSSKRHLFRTSGLVLTALLAVPLLNGCGADANSSDPPAADDAPVSIPVEVTEVSFGDVTSSYAGTATLVPERQTTAVAKLGGIVLGVALTQVVRFLLFPRDWDRLVAPWLLVMELLLVTGLVVLVSRVARPGSRPVA